MSEYKDDTFLSRWINGELSAEELSAFRKSKEYAVYNKIREASSLIDSAGFDEELILQNIKKRRKTTRSSQKSWFLPAAASVLVLLGFVFYALFPSTDLTIYETGIGEKMKIELPDGSNVTLNSNSLLSFVPDSWEKNRELNLEGQGFFDVEKGQKFTVHTKGGDVSVLGTQFSIRQLDDFFEVICFEGSVKVESSDEEEVLRPKTGVRRISRSELLKLEILSDKPAWINGKSVFREVPMKYVILDLSSQYGIEFKGSELVDGKFFSGSFPHDNLDLALRLVFDPANLKFKKEGNTIVISAN